MFELSTAALPVIFMAAKLLPGRISDQFAPPPPFGAVEVIEHRCRGGDRVVPWMTAVGCEVAVVLPELLVAVTATAIVLPWSAAARV